MRRKHTMYLLGWVALGFVTGCDRYRDPVDPPDDELPPELVASVRELAVEREIEAMPAPPEVRAGLVQLGEALAFDKLLSGNRDISCMTCHMPAVGTGDGRSLSIGQGAAGLGVNRVHPDGAFIPRNAPPLFNLSSLETMFWDGRVTVDDAGTVHSPAGEAVTPAMSDVFEFGSVSALSLFPVLSREEMRGSDGNELAAIADTAEQAIWQGLMQRLGEVAEYRELFEAAYPGTPFEEMTFAHASNAIAGYLIATFSFTDTPWDRFLRGSDDALTLAQLTGAHTFLDIKCSICHNGPALTDNEFHNVAVAQFGPGQGHGATGRDDFGRMAITGLGDDQYRFRTTPLRNAEITAPYGHDGAFFELRDFVEHYSDSDLKLLEFVLPSDEPLLAGTLLPNFDNILATRDTIIHGVVLTPEVVDELMAFLSALTDPGVANLGSLVPSRVPSGLPIDRF